MASKRVCPHTITLFNFAGENEVGEARFKATVLQFVHVSVREGAGARETETDKTKLHIFDQLYNSKKTFCSHKEWMLLGDDAKNLYWTLSPDGSDYFAIGEYDIESEVLPTEITTFRIIAISRKEIGRKKNWHWRIEAR